MATAERPTPGPARSGERLAVLAAVVGSGAVTDGLVLQACGTAAVLPDVPVARAVPFVLGAVGAAVVAPSLLRVRRDLAGAVRRSIPDLYPFGRPWSQVALFALIVLGSVAFFQGTFESFTPAHSGGDLGSVPDQGAADALVAAAAAVIWALAAYTVLVVHRVIRLGRATESGKGVDVYGRTVDESPADLSVPDGVAREPTPPSLPVGYVFFLTLALAIAVSVAIQAAEVDTQPAPAEAWAWAQLALPVWVGFVASAVSAVDRGLRGLESRVRSAVRGGPIAGSGPSA